MAAQPDLWGDLEVAHIRTPAGILKEQAALLGQKTQQILEAKVKTHVRMGGFYHTFELVVPALDNYTYELFSVSHSADLYPVVVPGSQNAFLNNATGFSQRSLSGEAEFIEWLRTELSSPETKKIIGNLLAQANS